MARIALRRILSSAAITVGVLVLIGTASAQTTFSAHMLRADSLLRDGGIDSALALTSSLLRAERPEFVAGDTSAIDVLYRLGSSFEAEGQPSEAGNVYRTIIAILGSACNRERLRLADTLFSLGTMHFRHGSYLKAEVFCLKALEIWTGSGNERVVEAHVLLGNIVAQDGRIKEEIAHYSQAVELSKQHYGEDHLNTARAQVGLANVYLSDGKYAEAEPLYRWVLGVCSDSLVNNTRCIYQMLINLGLVYRKLGKYAVSEQQFQRALSILQNDSLPNAHGLASALQGLAATYLDWNRPDEALLHYQRALTITEEAFGAGNPHTIDLLNSLAEASLSYGEFRDAEKYQLAALQICDSALGRDHLSTAHHRATLGYIRFLEGRLVEAESLYTEALTVQEAVYGRSHRTVAQSLGSLSKVYLRADRFQESADLAAEVVHIRRQLLQDFSLVVSERDALLYSDELSRAIDAFLSAYFAASDRPEAAETTAVDILLAGKGEISDAIFERRNLLNQPMDSAAAEAWNSYRLALFQLSGLYVQGPTSADDVQFRTTLDSLSVVAKEREAKFAQSMERFSDHREHADIGCRGVAAQLPHNTILVEYVRYEKLALNSSEEDTPRYLVFTLDSDGATSIVDLGDAGRIEVAALEYRNHFARVSQSGHLPGETDRAEYDKIARDLYSYLWAPIHEAVQSKDLVFVAPDGMLNRISFATLIDESGNYLIEDVPTHYLSAGRDVLRLVKSADPTTGLLAIADPAFVTPTLQTDSAGVQIPFVGYTRSNCRELQNLELSPLPRTRDEIDRVINVWKTETHESVDTLLGIRATEGGFKQESHGKRVIHLSTHGYYLQGACAGEVGAETPSSDEPVVGEDPLLQSGLFLAGCMDSHDGPVSSEQEDGVLTAAEIAGMNLNGTQLVVLSACETGLGRLFQGEGVYGLRRAFQIAGARTVISTLWPISDELTAPMLPPIYRQSREPLPNRLRTTQLEWIATLRQNGLADHPYSWGAFIAQGDWQ